MMIQKILTGFLVIGLVAILSMPVAAAPPQPDYNKIVDIQLKYDATGYSVSSLEVRYGKAPNLNLRSGSLTGSILDTKGTVLKTFSMQQPAVAYGDILGSLPGESLIGYTEQQGAGAMTITVPYLPGMDKFVLSNTNDGAVLATADLAPTVTLFCADYPNDPDCQIRIAGEKSTAPDTSMYLVLAAVLSASVLLAAGFAVMTIRKRSGRSETPEKQTILIVDDNPDIVDMLHLLLERKGYTTLMAQSGKEALDIFKKHVPDLVLLDIMMEPMDGWQTLEEIRKTHDAKSLPVLMLTAKRLTAEEARKYRLYMDDYLQKPCEPAELYAAVEYFLERKQKFQDALNLAQKAGVETEKVTELAQLHRRISINKKLLDILHVPQAVPVAADLDILDTMSVADYINVKTRDNEKRVAQLRTEINHSFRSKGLPELNW
nr:response regulator [uncultured Methanoregula sp.]